METNYIFFKIDLFWNFNEHETLVRLDPNSESK